MPAWSTISAAGSATTDVMIEKTVTPPAGAFRLEKVSLGLLPMRMVPIVREKQVALGLFERFLLEAALTFSIFETADLEAVTGLPANAIDRGLWQLRSSGAIEEFGDTSDSFHWRSRPEAIHAMLDSNTRTELYREEISLLGLACSNELLACPARSDNVHRLESFVSAGKMPISNDIVGLDREEWINQGHANRRIHRLPAGTRDFPGRGKDEPLGRLCQRFEAVVEFSAIEPKAASDEPPPANVTILEETSGQVARFTFPRDMRIVCTWQEKVSFLNEAETRSLLLERLNLPKNGVGGVDWNPHSGLTIRINSDVAERISESQVSIVDPFGMRLQLQNEILVIRVSFVPKGGSDDEWFRMDRLISHLTHLTAEGAEHATLASELTKGCNVADGLDPVSVRSRAWRLGLHPLVYRLREAEDFHYS